MVFDWWFVEYANLFRHPYWSGHATATEDLSNLWGYLRAIVEEEQNGPKGDEINFI